MEKATLPSLEPVPRSPRNLKVNCLSYPEVLAQSISVLAPSTVPATIFGLLFVSAGNRP